jgi:outer membrane protein assembly factor BamB
MENLGEPFENAPAMSNKKIFAASEEGTVFAVSADTSGAATAP